LLEDSVEERMEKALSDSDKTEIDSNKEGDAEDNKVGSCYVQSQEYLLC
jgi:hypothetical protein